MACRLTIARRSVDRCSFIGNKSTCFRAVNYRQLTPSVVVWITLRNYLLEFYDNFSLISAFNQWYITVNMEAQGVNDERAFACSFGWNGKHLQGEAFRVKKQSDGPLNMWSVLGEERVSTRGQRVTSRLPNHAILIKNCSVAGLYGTGKLRKNWDRCQIE